MSLGVLPKSCFLSGPEARFVMHPGSFLLDTVANSAAAFFAEGNTVTLSLTVSVPALFWNCRLFTDGGFSLTREVATPMQRASWVSPTVLFGLLGVLVV